MSEKLYAMQCEYDNDYIGTLDNILEYLSDNDVSIGTCKFYEVGKEMVITLAVKEKK